MKKNRLQFFGFLTAAVLLYGLAWNAIWPKPYVDPIYEEIRLADRQVFVCSIVCDDFKLKKWLGRDFGTLITFGTCSKSVWELRSQPEDKAKALRRIKSIAKEHGLQFIK